MAERGQLCVGIDPHPALLHAWGLGDDPAGLESFALLTVEAMAGEVAAVKPQSAFFERHGSGGIAVLERVISAGRDAGLIVILDAKRGDIGSTVQAYADAYLDHRSPLAVDAITAHPFLGFGSLDPLFDTALEHGGGVFVLALTSNSEGAEVQGARSDAGTTVAGSVLRQIAVRNAGAEPLGSIGAVIGANLDRIDEDLAINGPILAPGLGAQGGSPAGLAKLFGAAWPNVLATTSRDVLAAGPDQRALRDKAASVAADLAALRRL
jgi:orotidine 5'-phosphate decarboxylase subfamily 2